MECINELTDSLNVYFGWNKARMTCFVNMLLALIATRTVNLNKLACVVFGDALQSSRYRRIHRTGEWQNEQKPIKIKKHGRPAVSLFRYGLDFLCDSIVRLAYKTNHFQQALKILNSMPSPICS